ncbi:MAG: RelA/SpoT domain-containing protein [Chloroflexi bacterium]|nr:RelA/SpoT domain-containing protein [Chloroflexota bacterium]
MPNMFWAVPPSNLAIVDHAGTVLVKRPDGVALVEALDVINNWRSAHAFPLNTFQNGLRQKANYVDRHSIVAQRIKRLSSIAHKLHRFKGLRLSEMQDIGGCRAVVASIKQVEELVKAFKQSAMKHKLIDEDDYITNPKGTGYRGYHLIYQYRSARNDTYNGLKVEIQLRSKLQHAWATAIETVGTFIGQPLKSSEGPKDWLRFFALMGSEIAIREKTVPVPRTPTTESELLKEIREYANELDVEKYLQTFRAVLLAIDRVPDFKRAHFFLVSLDTISLGTNQRTMNVSVQSYTLKDLGKASRDYQEAEEAVRENRSIDAVLVSADSITHLRRAYPNYFLDTRAFLDEVKRAIGS